MRECPILGAGSLAGVETFPCPCESRPHSADRNVKSLRDLVVAQLLPCPQQQHLDLLARHSFELSSKGLQSSLAIGSIGDFISVIEDRSRERKPADRPSPTIEAPPVPLHKIRGHSQQPGPQRAVEKSKSLALPPGLKERLRNDLFREIRISGAALHEPIDQIGMTVEDALERHVITVYDQRPIPRIATHVVDHRTSQQTGTVPHTTGMPAAQDRVPST